MQAMRRIFIPDHVIRWTSVLLILILGILAVVAPASAQTDAAAQEIVGTIYPGEIVLYRLNDLQKGQQLYAYAKPQSGNLDPVLGIVKADVDPQALVSEFDAALGRAIADGLDPLEATEDIFDTLVLAWDDDSGGGLTAALAFDVPDDGDYRLLVIGTVSSLSDQTFGDYRLLIGLDTPQVMEGEAQLTGHTIALPDIEATQPGVGVEELTGSLAPDRTSTFMTLYEVKAEDTFYAFIESSSSDLIPILTLKNFAGKPIRSANLDGSSTAASLQYTFPADDQNYLLEILSYGEDDQQSAGDYRLLVGINAPEVLTGQAQPMGRPVIKEPIQVDVGVRLEQIIEVDQQSEFFTAVVSLKMEWTDPALAFNPESCHCDYKSLSGSNVDKFLADKPWPDFSLQNQQGNRWIQNQNLVISPNGHALYYERFTTNFQVDFDFQQYPFDTQEFVIRVDSLYPEEIYTYAHLEDFSQISREHGEDEFKLTDFSTTITSRQNPNGSLASRLSFQFQGPRHLSYYIFAIFLPILLIISVSWVTFFLKDYGRRIEVASANLLLFIAFSWSLADNYPRLGYLTFLDAVMAIMFVINALVVVYNVWLKRMELRGHEAKAERIDRILDWIYPVTYIVCFGVVILWFF